MQNNLKLTITFAVVLVFSGLTLLSLNFINNKREAIFSEVNLHLSTALFDESDINIDEVIEEDNNTTITNEETTNTETTTPVYESYIGRIEIPKIDLVRGFYDKTSVYNNVNSNIKVLKESDYPDVANGNLILAAHSGNYYNSYFGNLYKLEIGDIAYIYYNDTKYTYEIVNIYNEDKDGDVVIRRSANKTVLTLITCTKDDEEHQTIYILEQI